MNKEDILLLKNKLSQLSLEEQTDLLENYCGDCDIVILTTGPSLLDYSPEKIKDFCKDKIVLSIKTASLKFEDITHFSITNFYNTFQPTGNERFVTLARRETKWGTKNYVNGHLVVRETWANSFNIRPDVLWGCDNTVMHSNSVCYANRWEENELKNQKINRILGPGILNDMAIPVAVHLGASKIYFLGWDGSQLNCNGNVTHFYTTDSDYKPTVNLIDPNFNLNNLKADLQIDEQEIVRNSELYLLNYLNKKNIKPYILSKSSFVNNKFERFSL